jgi:hypothetical protein
MNSSKPLAQKTKEPSKKNTRTIIRAEAPKTERPIKKIVRPPPPPPPQKAEGSRKRTLIAKEETKNVVVRKVKAPSKVAKAAKPKTVVVADEADNEFFHMEEPIAGNQRMAPPEEQPATQITKPQPKPVSELPRPLKEAPIVKKEEPNVQQEHLKARFNEILSKKKQKGVNKDLAGYIANTQHNAIQKIKSA